MKFLVVVALAIAAVLAEPEADPVYYSTVNGVYPSVYAAPSVYATPSVYGYANAYNPYGYRFIGKRSADAEPEAEAKADPLYYYSNVAGASPLVYNTPVTTYGYPTVYNPYGVRYIGKRSADAEPEAKADALYYNGVYNGYQPYVAAGYGYQPLANTYSYGYPSAGYRFIGKRSANAEPEAKADALYYNGVYNGYQPYVAAGYGYQPLTTAYSYGYPSAGYRFIGKRSADAEPEAKADALYVNGVYNGYQPYVAAGYGYPTYATTYGAYRYPYAGYSYLG